MMMIDIRTISEEWKAKSNDKDNDDDFIICH
jgi:hypothetical protein